MILTLCVAAFSLGVEPNLPTGHFVLVEGPILKRQIKLRVTQSTIKDGKPVVSSKLQKFPLSKTLEIDAEGGFTERLFAGRNPVTNPDGKWRYEATGATTIRLTALDGAKRDVAFDFDGKRLTLRSGRNQIEVFEKN